MESCKRLKNLAVWPQTSLDSSAGFSLFLSPFLFLALADAFKLALLIFHIRMGSLFLLPECVVCRLVSTCCSHALILPLFHLHTLSREIFLPLDLACSCPLAHCLSRALFVSSALSSACTPLAFARYMYLSLASPHTPIHTQFFIFGIARMCSCHDFF